jgi:hypothetical protein
MNLGPKTCEESIIVCAQLASILMSKPEASSMGKSAA